MQARERGSRRDRERGTIMVLVLILSLVVGFITATAVSTSLTHGRDIQVSLDRAEALALAEGVTEAAQKRLLTQAANFQPLELTGTIDINGVAYGYEATPLGSPIERTDPDGVQLAIQPYEIESFITVDTGSARVTRIVDLTMTPIFQYMIFFRGDLEILPGPNMLLGGRVHSNADIYVGAGNTLTVDTDYFRCTGSILRERKNNGSETGGVVDIRVSGSGSFVNMAPDMDSNHTDWVDLALTTWNGTVQDGSHGVREVQAPSIGSIKAFNDDGTRGYYHANADLVIRDGVAFDRFDNPVPLPPGTIQEVQMYDGREGQEITVTEVNMQLLNASGSFPANGLIYAYRTDASASQPNGIRLTEGEELAGPLTVVTEDPLYIHGDYNTIDKKGAAVMADAVNLLSNAWDDTKGPGQLPAAEDTTFNLAMVSGNVPTPDGGGPYSGGFENMPRFHESWSGRTATIRGSFVSLYDSEIGVSPWQYGGDVYRAPNRDWQFDPDLLDPANLPPFTPNAVYFRRVIWDDNIPLPF